MNIYIDESGNLGKQGKYFVITALVILKKESGKKRLQNIVKNFLKKSDKNEIKGVDLSFSDRQKIIVKLILHLVLFIIFIKQEKLMIIKTCKYKI